MPHTQEASRSHNSEDPPRNCAIFFPVVPTWFMSYFLVERCCCKERLYMSLYDVICPSIPFFFSPLKIICHFHFFMHFWMFHAILSAQKKFTPIFFSPKFFLQWAVGEARHDTMLPSILVSNYWNHAESWDGSKHDGDEQPLHDETSNCAAFGMMLIFTQKVGHLGLQQEATPKVWMSCRPAWQNGVPT